MDVSEKEYQTNFRVHMPDLTKESHTTNRTCDTYEYSEDLLVGHQPAVGWALCQHWMSLGNETYKGITNDGGPIRPDLYKIQDEGMPIEEIAAAGKRAVELCTPAQRKALCYHVDSPEWRTWSQFEFLLSDKGVRLDELTTELRDAILGVLEATFSPEGYQKALASMRINHFLGELVNMKRVMNVGSYNFVVFGAPSEERPWGWALYGHHLCLNAFFYKKQVFISPWFTGGEPNMIDDGPWKGTRVGENEERLGLKLMQSLSHELQEKATVFKQVEDSAMPPGRWNPVDQRHLGGAYRDNRVIPYEGVKISNFSAEQRALVWEIGEQYLLYLRQPARKIQLDRWREFEDETYFCWIGGSGDDDPFYYRIQSPVAMMEFDHHGGFFLKNARPAKFHVHMLLRMPNAGDYGMAIRPQIPVVEDKFITELVDIGGNAELRN